MRRTYTFILFCLTIALNAQIVHLDFGEEGLSVPMNANLAMDIDDDGSEDFYVNSFANELGFSPITTIGCFASPSSGTTIFGSQVLSTFKEGETIQITDSNLFDYIDDGRGSIYSGNETEYAQTWEDGVSQYIGFAVFTGGFTDVLNGWLEISIDESNQTLIIHDGAYHEGIINHSSIDAGETGLTSTEKLLPIKEICVYPNPSSNFLNIKLDETIQGASKISIVSINGSVVMTQTTINSSDIVRLNIAEIPAGQYLVNIRTESGLQVKAITIE